MATTFKGPIRTGEDTGIPATTTLGTVVLQQEVTISANTSGATNMVLPPNSKIVDFVLDSFSSTPQSDVLVGTGADDDQFASIRSSAAGRYRPGVAPNLTAVSAVALNDTGASATRLWVDVTGTDVSGFSGFLGVHYVQR